jgi:ABC-type multidrug transport system fused ATPase/permease subunit
MKEFVIYTVLRILLFFASLAVVTGLWLAITGEVSLTIAILVSMVISGVASYFVLNRYRARFAAVVEERAARATAAFDEMKAKEDAD